MKYTTDAQLKSMARSLQKHIGLANDLDLPITAQLLAMAVIEITTKVHGISQHELDALCERSRKIRLATSGGRWCRAGFPEL